MRDFANKGRVELYDLQTDPGETVNLADSNEPRHVAARERLEQKILERMKAFGDAPR
jgi:hypothetical protein